MIAFTVYIISSYWSQLVTFVTVKASDLNNDGLDVYFDPYGIILGTCYELSVSHSFFLA